MLARPDTSHTKTKGYGALKSMLFLEIAGDVKAPDWHERVTERLRVLQEIFEQTKADLFTTREKQTRLEAQFRNAEKRLLLPVDASAKRWAKLVHAAKIMATGAFPDGIKTKSFSAHLLKAQDKKRGHALNAAYDRLHEAHQNEGLVNQSEFGGRIGRIRAKITKKPKRARKSVRQAKRLTHK